MALHLRRPRLSTLLLSTAFLLPLAVPALAGHGLVSDVVSPLLPGGAHGDSQAPSDQPGNVTQPPGNQTGNTTRPPGNSTGNVTRPPGNSTGNVTQPPGNHTGNGTRPPGNRTGNVTRPPGNHTGNVTRPPGNHTGNSTGNSTGSPTGNGPPDDGDGDGADPVAALLDDLPLPLRPGDPPRTPSASPSWLAGASPPV